MSNEALIAVTGANGFLGLHIVQQFLQKGIRVRAVVRTQQAGAIITKLFPNQNQNGLISLAIVPDILAGEDVYNDAFDNATAVIHTASPIFEVGKPTQDAEKDFYAPAIQGALNAIKAAARTSTVKRFIYTGSVVSSFPEEGYGDVLHSYINPIDAKSARAYTDGQHAYRASKAFSERALWHYFHANKPHFHLTVLLPSLIVGPPLDPNTPLTTGSNSIYLLWAQKPELFIETDASTLAIDVRDCAKAHVNVALMQGPHSALDGQRLFVSERTLHSVEAANIASTSAPSFRKRWPSGIDDNIAAILSLNEDRIRLKQRSYSVPEAEVDAKQLDIFPLRNTLETLKEIYHQAEGKS